MEEGLLHTMHSRIVRLGGIEPGKTVAAKTDVRDHDETSLGRDEAS